MNNARRILSKGSTLLRGWYTYTTPSLLSDIAVIYYCVSLSALCPHGSLPSWLSALRFISLTLLPMAGLAWKCRGMLEATTTQKHIPRIETFPESVFQRTYLRRRSNWSSVWIPTNNNSPKSLVELVLAWLWYMPALHANTTSSLFANLFPGSYHTIPMLAHLLLCWSSSDCLPQPAILRQLSSFIAHLASFPTRLLSGEDMKLMRVRRL